MLAIVSGWAGLVAERRPASKRPRRDIAELSGFLLSHLHWLAEEPAVVDAAKEICGIVRTAENAIEPPGATRLELGRCDKPDCDAIVYATMGATSQPTRVGCEHGHLWRPDEWLVLGLRLERAARQGGAR
jgi:hypothetical protein